MLCVTYPIFCRIGPLGLLSVVSLEGDLGKAGGFFILTVVSVEPNKLKSGQRGAGVKEVICGSDRHGPVGVLSLVQCVAGCSFRGQSSCTVVLVHA